MILTIRLISLPANIASLDLFHNQINFTYKYEQFLTWYITWRVSYEQTSLRFGAKDGMIDSHFEIQILDRFGDGYQCGHFCALVLKIHLRIGDNKLRRELMSVIFKMWIGVHLDVELQVAESLLIPSTYYSIKLLVGSGVQLHFSGLMR